MRTRFQYFRYSFLNLLVSLVVVGLLIWGDFYQTVTADGEVKCEQYVSLNSLISGIIKELRVKKGDLVQRGDLLIQFDDMEYKARLNQAKINIERIKAEISKIEVLLENSLGDFERYEALHANGSIPTAQLEEVRTNYLSTKADMTLANVNLKQAEVALELAQRDYDHTKVFAPFTGILVEVLANQYAYIGQFDPLLVLEDSESKFFELNINETQISQVKIGQKAKILLEAFPYHQYGTFEGIVSNISPKGEDINGTIYFKVNVKIVSDEGSTQPISLIRSKMKGKGRIIIRKINIFNYLFGT